MTLRILRSLSTAAASAAFFSVTLSGSSCANNADPTITPQAGQSSAGSGPEQGSPGGAGTTSGGMASGGMAGTPLPGGGMAGSPGSSGMLGAGGPSGGTDSNSNGATGGAPTAGGPTAGAPTAGAPAAGAPAGGTGGTGGTAGSDGASGAACTIPTAAQTCSGAVPKKRSIVDWSTYMSDGKWGVEASGDLTGGTSKFQGMGVEPLTLTAEGTGITAAVHVTGNIPSESYAGFVLWFGPCVNAASITNEAEIEEGMTPTTSPTTGFTTELGGSLGGAQLKLQVQTHLNYPVDAANMKGGCLFTSCDTQWSDCVSPTKLIETVPADRSAQSFPWSDFTAGKPEAATTGDGIVGLQFQFECVAETPCALDLTLGNIDFTL